MTWEEPAFTNGEIINYYINVNGTITIESSGSETDFFVSSLDPRFNHRMRVQACTSEGCGPFSNEEMNTSYQDGGEISCSAVHREHVMVISGFYLLWRGRFYQTPSTPAYNTFVQCL